MGIRYGRIKNTIKFSKRLERDAIDWVHASGIGGERCRSQTAEFDAADFSAAYLIGNGRSSGINAAGG